MITLLRGRRSSDKAVDTTRSEESDAPHAPARKAARPRAQQWTGGSALASRAVSVLMVGALTTGPVALVLTATSDSVVETVTQDPGPPVGDAVVAGESGVETVRAWLAATQEDSSALERLLPSAPTQGLPEIAADFRNVTIAGVEEVRDGTWRVLVGADLAETGAEESDDVQGEEPPPPTWVRRYFQVPVLVEAGEAATVALPSPTENPLRTSATQLGYDDELSTSSETGSAVAEFLAAYLAGVGDIDRYTSPAAAIEALAPAPYDSVALSDLVGNTPAESPGEDGSSVEVLATADLTRADDSGVRAQYVLRLESRAGRWEVAEIQSAPHLTVSSDLAGETTEETEQEGEVQ